MNLAQHILIGAIRAYRLLLWPALRLLLGGNNCRFTPSCSEYALQAVRERVAGAGGWLALRRVLRCHPWGGCGEDPMPPAPCCHDGGVGGVLNSKSETRNSKQMQMAEKEMSKTRWASWFRAFLVRILNLFRISDFGFRISRHGS